MRQAQLIPHARQAAALALLAILGTVHPSQQPDTRDQCAQRLKELGQICLLYAEEQGGKIPASLSVLYYQVYVTELTAFVCPGSKNTIVGRDEIDAKSDFILSPQSAAAGAGALVQDRSPENHGGLGINVFYRDGSVRWQPALNITQTTASEQGQPQIPSQPTPLTQTTPEGAAIRSKSRLGLMIGSHDGQGVKIVDVMVPSPASRAGLRSGDLILELGEKGFYELSASPAGFSAFVSSLPPAQPVRAMIQRGAGRFETVITPEELVLDPQKTAQAKAAYDKGRKLVEARDYAGAVRCFNEAILYDPHQSAIYSALAEVHFKRGDLASEIEALRKGTATAPSYGLYSLLGFAYRRANRFDEGIETFIKAVALMLPNRPDANVFEQLGFCYMKKRRYREALASFESAYQANPGSPAATYFLGGCHDVLDDRDQAVRWYQAYLDLRHNDEKWNQYARRRLDTLRRGPRTQSKAADQLLTILDAFIDGLAQARGGQPAQEAPCAPVSFRPAAGAGISGEWSWFDRSIVLIRDDGSFSTSNRLTGNWRLADSSGRRYTLIWSHGYTDTLTLSPDGLRLEGTNNKGMRVWGRRRAS
jgi:tetratricopeptide (TPR) repeat protein